MASRFVGLNYIRSYYYVFFSTLGNKRIPPPASFMLQSDNCNLHEAILDPSQVLSTFHNQDDESLCVFMIPKLVVAVAADYKDL